jgi:hypothetical protein
MMANKYAVADGLHCLGVNLFCEARTKKLKPGSELLLIYVLQPTAPIKKAAYKDSLLTVV